jgi:exopolysaccharide production protein ExoZ
LSRVTSLQSRFVIEPKESADRAMRGNIQSIQFLRFVAASLVVFFHSTQAVNQYFGGGISQSILYASEFGASGVHIFFVISGFIMVYTSFSGPKADFSRYNFFLKRFVRIYPIYWFYCILYIAFHHYVGHAYDASAKELFGSFLLFPGYSPLIIGPGWTLSYEVYFYLCFGIVMALSLFRGLFILAIFFLLSIALGLAFHVVDPVLRVVTDSLLIEFLLGASVAYLIVVGVKLPVGLSYALQALALAGFLAGYLLGYSRFPSLIMWGIPSAALLAGLVFNERNGLLLNWVKKCAFLGDCSYSLYLIHILLIDVLLTTYQAIFGTLSSGNIGICLLLTALCITFAFVSYELLEKNLVGSLQYVLKARIAWARDSNQVD